MSDPTYDSWMIGVEACYQGTLLYAPDARMASGILAAQVLAWAIDHPHEAEQMDARIAEAQRTIGTEEERSSARTNAIGVLREQAGLA